MSPKKHGKKAYAFWGIVAAIATVVVKITLGINLPLNDLVPTATISNVVDSASR